MAAVRERFKFPAMESPGPLPAMAGDPAAKLVPIIGPSRAVSFSHDGDRLKPAFSGEEKTRSADLAFAATASEPFRITDRRSGLWLDVRMPSAQTAPAEGSDGYLVYRNAFGNGGNIIHRVDPDGTEDFVECSSAAVVGDVFYDVELSPSVAGLRLVSNTLEVLDASGTPRLRMSAPYVASADGHTVEITTKVRDCAMDSNPAPPWGRAVTAPGSRHCRVEFIWDAYAISYPALLDPMWQTTASMNAARECHTATALPGGNVLVAGGRTGGAVLGSAEVYNFPSNTWSVVQPMPPDGGTNFGRCWHTATLITAGVNSGRVLIAGGYDNNNQTSLASTLLFDPTAWSWSWGPTLTTPRYSHTATALTDGRVLIYGGFYSFTGAFLTSAEMYATNGTISAAGSLSPGRTSAAASRLGDGRVLVSGGWTGSSSIRDTGVYNPSTGAWSTGPLLTTARSGHAQTSLAGGNQVLVTGGYSGGLLSSVELYNGSTWATKAPMSAARMRPSAMQIPDGRILVAGGSTATFETQFYTVNTNTWSSATNINTPRDSQVMCDLGGVPLVTGGHDATNQALASSEAFFLTTATNTPVGALDFIRPQGSVYQAEGWALDLDYPSGQIYVHIYVDGKQPANYAGNCLTTVPRPDINTAYGVTGTHGFTCIIPSQFLDGNAHTLYVFAINVPTGNNPELLDSGTAFHDVNHNPVDDSHVTISLTSSTGSLIWNHAPYVNDRTYDHAPDGPARAVKNTNGTTFLGLPSGQNHSLAGTSTETLNQIYATYTSSRFTATPDITEADYNYEHWLTAPYYKYGKIYSVAHNEWHKCLLDPSACSGQNDWFNSWEASLTRFVSNDGTTYTRNPPNGPASAAHSNTWSSNWDYATDHHWGFFHPSNVIREADYFYLFATYLHRTLDASATQDAYGQVLLRTQRIDLATDWQILKKVQQGGVWVNTWVAMPASEPYQTLPFANSDHVSVTYNTVLHKYVVFHVPYDSPSWRYATTVSLANPDWSPAHDVFGSSTFHTVNSTYDPSSTVDTPGIAAGNYPNAVDPDSPGRNYEYTDGQFFMYYDTNWALITDNNQRFDRNLYRAGVSVTVN